MTAPLWAGHGTREMIRMAIVREAGVQNDAELLKLRTDFRKEIRRQPSKGYMGFTSRKKYSVDIH